MQKFVADILNFFMLPKGRAYICHFVCPSIHHFYPEHISKSIEDK